jgi:uncharacterized protein with PIN domain
MLGRLAKWLRLLGYDTTYYSAASDPELARRARAEGRVLLTRDHELASRRGLQTLFITSEVLEEQVQQVIEFVGPPPRPPHSRCSVCNPTLDPVEPAEIADRVPPYVLRTQTDFRRCPGCSRVYWPGTHRQGMAQLLESIDPQEQDNA